MRRTRSPGAAAQVLTAAVDDAVDDVVVRPAVPADAAEVADVWLASFDDALPTVRRAHDDTHARAWITGHLVPETDCWVATVGGRVAAVLSCSPGWIDQLYVAPEHQGRGLGSRLVGLAQERSAGDLQLWTFQVNARARAFYARHGFREVELTDGSTNQEREPDVRLRWTRGD